MVRRLLETGRAGWGWVRHVYRELNTQADSLATRGLSRKRSFLENYTVDAEDEDVLFIRGSFDGGSKKAHGAAGWRIEVWTRDRVWSTWKQGAVYLPVCSSTKAELLALQTLLRMVEWMVQAGSFRDVCLLEEMPFSV